MMRTNEITKAIPIASPGWNIAAVTATVAAKTATVSRYGRIRPRSYRGGMREGNWACNPAPVWENQAVTLRAQRPRKLIGSQRDNYERTKAPVRSFWPGLFS